MLHIRLLGNFVITHNHEPVVAFTRTQLKTLLVHLVLQRSASPARDELIRLLWRVKPDSQSRTNLRNLFYYLRQAFPAIECYWAIHDNPVAWDPASACWFDVAEFEAALHQAAQTQHGEEQAAALAHALDLYTGDLWPECREEWILPERERLRTLYIGALEQFIDLLELKRDYQSALQAAQRLLQDTPLREESYRRVIHLYACLADRDGVERTFQECQTQLAHKLKVAPSLPTRELYTRLTLVTAAAQTLKLPPFVERRREWTHLQSAWEQAQQGKPHCILLTGDAGIGKTRLLTEFRLSLERRGLAAATAQCHPFTLDVAYAPLLDWLRTPLMRRRMKLLTPLQRTHFAYLLPELDTAEAELPLSASPLASWQRQRLYETLVQLFLAHDEPLLLVMDNAQWCDHATIEWLHYLLLGAPAAKLLVLGAFSPLELRPHYPVAGWRPRFQQSQLATELCLAPLTLDGVTDLGRMLGGAPLSTTTSAQLYQVTEGNPLYVVEALRRAPANLVTLTQADVIEDGLLRSPIVQATLQLYFVALSPLACDVVGLAATIGHTFTVDLLATAALANRETLLLALDELLQRNIVRDYSESAYCFGHYLLHRAAYTALSSAKRRLWHERVIQARQQLTQVRC